MILLVIISLIVCEILGDELPVQITHSATNHSMARHIDISKISLIQIYPYITSIQTNNSHICEGSIFSESIILTTAHCVSKYPPSSLSVRVGSTRHDYGGSMHQVVAKKSHENYRNISGVLVNNLALLTVSPPFKYGMNVNSVCLPEKGDVVASGTVANIAGWRWMAEERQTSSMMERSKLRVLGRNTCANYHGIASGRWISSNGLFCAGAPDTDTCADSSGVPLIINYCYQIGILSQGSNCTNRLYVNVLAYLDWIEENAGDLELHENVDQDFTDDLLRNITQEPPENTIQDLSKETTQNPPKNITHNLSEITTQNQSSNVTRNISDEHLAKNITQNPPQNPSHNPQRNITRNTPVDHLAKNVTQNPPPKITQIVPAETVSHNITQDSVQNTIHNPSGNTTQNPPVNATQNPLRNVNHHTLYENVILRFFVSSIFAASFFQSGHS